MVPTSRTVKSGSQISAGEIEKYGYCPLNWWLYRQGVSADDERLEEGQRRHESLANDLTHILRAEERARQWERLVLYFALAASVVAIFGLTILGQLDPRYGLILVILSLIWLLAATFLLYRAETLVSQEDRLVVERLLVIFAMVATVIALLVLSLAFLNDPILAAIFEVVALLWLVGASFFLYKSLRDVAEAQTTRASRKLGEQSIAYVDGARGGGSLLTSTDHDLTGRPDFILQDGGQMIPVEVKTGRRPRGPLFSHILQLAAYCLLVEEHTGQRPPYGLLRYGETVHEIEYDDDLRNLVLGKLAEMRGALAQGEAHRNHNRPGKCEHCSRRHACPERLA